MLTDAVWMGVSEPFVAENEENEIKKTKKNTVTCFTKYPKYNSKEKKHILIIW